MTAPEARYDQKDNEFIAWYPPALSSDGVADVWAPREAAFYVHIPFCTAICDYCGFAVQRERDGDQPRYLAAVHAEIQRSIDQGRLARLTFTCGHFGGGTPSVLPAAELVAIAQRLARGARVTPDAELTVEVNPISFTAEQAATYLAGGVTRISLGVQSFDEAILRTIGRPHRREDVEAALATARDCGVGNFSLDLIYGVPGQAMRQLREDLLRAVDSGATHLSCFRLEIIPFTVLKLREAAGELPDRLAREVLDEMDDLVAEVLVGEGFVEYGAFNFARPGYESVHNRIAFMAPQGEYVGFGNGAYSFADGHIYCNDALIPRYVEAVEAGRDPIAFSRRVSSVEEMSRYFVLGLKFFRVPRAPFQARFGRTPEEVFALPLDALTRDGMLRREDDDYVLTAAGRRYVNNVCKEFYDAGNQGRRQQVQFVPTLTPGQILAYSRRAGLAPEAAGAR